MLLEVFERVHPSAEHESEQQSVSDFARRFRLFTQEERLLTARFGMVASSERDLVQRVT